MPPGVGGHDLDCGGGTAGAGQASSEPHCPGSRDTAGLRARLPLGGGRGRLGEPGGRPAAKARVLGQEDARAGAEGRSGPAAGEPGLATVKADRGLWCQRKAGCAGPRRALGLCCAGSGAAGEKPPGLGSLLKTGTWDGVDMRCRHGLGVPQGKRAPVGKLPFTAGFERKGPERSTARVCRRTCRGS